MLKLQYMVWRVKDMHYKMLLLLSQLYYHIENSKNCTSSWIIIKLKGLLSASKRQRSLEMHFGSHSCPASQQQLWKVPWKFKQ